MVRPLHKYRAGIEAELRMKELKEHRSCAARCKAPVPAELDSVGLCLSHFTLSVEQTCAEMHRRIATRDALAECHAEVRRYIGECVLLLARVTSNLSLSDELKKRILCTFLSLMNLRESLDRAETHHRPESRAPGSGLATNPVAVLYWPNTMPNTQVRS